MKPGILATPIVDDARVTVLITKHAPDRFAERHLSELKVRAMIDDALPQVVDVLRVSGKVLNETAVNFVIRWDSGDEVIVAGASMKAGGFRTRDGQQLDAVQFAVVTVHKREGFMTRDATDIDLFVPNGGVRLRFDEDTEPALREEVTAAMVDVLAEESLEDGAGYHIETDIVDFWLTPERGGITIEAARWQRETYVIDVP